MVSLGCEAMAPQSNVWSWGSRQEHVCSSRVEFLQVAFFFGLKQENFHDQGMGKPPGVVTVVVGQQPVLGEAIEERESARVEFAAGHIVWLCGGERSGFLFPDQRRRGAVTTLTCPRLGQQVTTPAASRAARAAPFAPYPRTRGDT